MKKIFVVFILVITMVSFILTGCDRGQLNEDPQEPIHAVLILGATSNTPVINTSAVAEVIERVCSQEGSTISLIVADGAPYLYDELTAPEINSSFSATKQKQIIEARVVKVKEIVGQSLAVSPHADWLKAIELGARILQGYQDGYEKDLIILGSLLSDVTPLDFSSMYLDNLDVDSVLDNLKKSNNIAELENCNVEVFFAGETMEPQKPLTNVEKEILKEIWKNILEAGNPKTIHFASNLPSNLAYENLPEVNTVPVIVERTALEELDSVDAVVLSEQTIAFCPGTSELVNEAAAMEAISVLSAYMEEHSDVQALLVGTTACWGDENSSIALSFERGMTIKSLFKNAGIDSERVKVIGGGWLTNFYEDDQSEDGSLIEEIAKKNRSTVWIDQNSPLADLVMNSEFASKFMYEQ